MGRLSASASIAAACFVILASPAVAAQTDRACWGVPPYSTLVILGALALVPLVFMAATSFVKLSIVLSILRNALGIGQVPSGAIIAVLAAVLTFYVMAPVGGKMVEASAAEAAGIDLGNPASRASLEATVKVVDAGKEPLRHFLKRNAGTREIDLFVRLGQRANLPAKSTAERANDFIVVLPAFLLTELKEAFQIGFLVYIPFLVIDLVVANVLLAMGMQMLSPAAVSLPFKLLIFVLVDGWYLLAQALVLGYNT